MRPAEAKRALVDATAANQAGDLAVSIQKAAQSLGRFGTDYPKIIHVVSDLQLSAIEKLDQLSLPPNVTLRVAKAGEFERRLRAAEAVQDVTSRQLEQEHTKLVRSDEAAVEAARERDESIERYQRYLVHTDQI